MVEQGCYQMLQKCKIQPSFVVVRHLNMLHNFSRDQICGLRFCDGGIKLFVQFEWDLGVCNAEIWGFAMLHTVIRVFGEVSLITSNLLPHTKSSILTEFGV